MGIRGNEVSRQIICKENGKIAILARLLKELDNEFEQTKEYEH
jgi:hypothetical protein